MREKVRHLQGVSLTCSEKLTNEMTIARGDAAAAGDHQHPDQQQLPDLHNAGHRCQSQLAQHAASAQVSCPTLAHHVVALPCTKATRCCQQ